MSSDSDDMPLAKAPSRGESILPGTAYSSPHLLLPASSPFTRSRAWSLDLNLQFPFASLYTNTADLANRKAVSSAQVSNGVDKAMDKAGEKSNYAPAGVSIRNGPVVEDAMDVDGPATNGAPKRKARVSTGKPVNYNVDSGSEEDAKPLVRTPTSKL